MTVSRFSRMKARVNILFHNAIVRYLFAIVTVASTFAFRIWLTPFTGTGAPFVLFFAAVVVLTMLAAEALDPRLIWDSATPREPAHG